MHEDAYRKTYLDVHVVRGSAARTYRLIKTNKQKANGQGQRHSQEIERDIKEDY